jgi:hypothetical protein
MSKSIDFTKTGGFPLTQNRLAYLQTAYNEMLQALAAIGGAAGMGGVPVVLTGMAVSGGGNTVSSGWFFYNGQLVKFTGGTVVPGGGEVSLVLLTNTSTPLTYNDGSTPSVVNETTGSLTHAASVTDATHFPVSALTPWYTSDPVVAAEITTIIAELTELLGPWQAAWGVLAPPYITFTGGGTFLGGTIPYNKCLVNGKTITWQLQLRGYTVAAGGGALNTIVLNAPDALLATGVLYPWKNPGQKVWGTIDVGGPPILLECILTNVGGGGGAPVLTLQMGGGPFTTGGGVNIDISFTAETA